MKKIVMAAAAMALCVPLFAQNINQSVQVTNDYETRFADFQKHGVDLVVPDSLYRFDYNFDYSVFETPYRGSYEFSPYLIKVTPTAMPYEGKVLRLRAGAGVSLHPLLDIVYTPLSGEKFAMSIFNLGSGFVGNYRAKGAMASSRGHDLSDSLGVAGHWSGKQNIFTFQTGYDGIFAGAGSSSSCLHSGYLKANLESAPSLDSNFSYDIGFSYRYSGDVRSEGYGNIGEHLFGCNGSLGSTGSMSPERDYNFMMDFDFVMDNMGDGRASFRGASAGLAGFRPHITFRVGRFDIDAGARIDYSYLEENGSFAVAPVATAGISLFNDTFRVLAGVTGGRKLNSMFDLKSANHFYIRSNSCPAISLEKINAFLSFEGNAFSALQYSVKGGYAIYVNSPLAYVMSYAFLDYNAAYVNLKASWTSERLDIDGALDYTYTEISAQNAYAPAALTSNFRAVYNWIRRIYAGVSIEGASARKIAPADLGSFGEIPGYVDLGLFGEYRFNSKWSAWMHGGNLAGMAIERAPGFVEKGPYFTVGIGLNL